MKKEQKFNKVLKDAKHALDSVGIPFHLHAGTALGAIRNKTFIPHDHDIDLAVFSKDVNTAAKVKKLTDSMQKNGFDVVAKLGTLGRGKEIQFEHVDLDVPLDIFWVYPGEYDGKKYNIVSSYYGECDKLKYKTCVWGYRPYKTESISFLGSKYQVVPEYTLVDMYGSDWKTPKKFAYHEGITTGGYKGFIPDYYEPRIVDCKIAFCFLLYDSVKHRGVWEKFFNQDKFSKKSYSIYAHLKEKTKNTPDWIGNNAIKSIKTDWCDDSLVWAWVNMLKEAMKDKQNEYFCLLSGECIPLFTFWETYDKITSSPRARIHVDYDAEPALTTGLYYADQWVILTRETAKAMIELQTTTKGKSFVKKIRKHMCDSDEDQCFCADELYPVNWFAHKYGRVGFSKHISKKVATYTHWSGKSHPDKFNKPKMQAFRNKICKSGAIFARKFNEPSAKELAMSCGSKHS